jgi:hypothetical protein
MRCLILYFSCYGSEALKAKIVNDPTMDTMPGPDTASQLIDDLGADTVSAVIQLPDDDFRPDMTDGATGREIEVEFIDNPSEA